MKILLDENLDHKVRRLLEGHEVVTVRYAGWAGTKNGALLRRAESAGFDILLTGDQTLQYEQNLSGRRIAVIVLSTVKTELIEGSIEQVLQAIEHAQPGAVVSVPCGTLTRKRRREASTSE